MCTLYEGLCWKWQEWSSIQDFDTIVSSKISVEMESLKICKESLISMEIDTFDRLRSGLNSIYVELL